MELPETIFTKEIYAMSIISQNNTKEVALLDCIQRFFSKHHIGKLLAKCNGTKEKGVPAISLLSANFACELH